MNNKNITKRFKFVSINNKQTIKDTLSGEDHTNLESICKILNDMDKEIDDAYILIAEDITSIVGDIKKIEEEMNIKYEDVRF